MGHGGAVTPGICTRVQAQCVPTGLRVMLHTNHQRDSRNGKNGWLWRSAGKSGWAGRPGECLQLMVQAVLLKLNCRPPCSLPCLPACQVVCLHSSRYAYLLASLQPTAPPENDSTS